MVEDTTVTDCIEYPLECFVDEDGDAVCDNCENENPDCQAKSETDE
ncbi:MAG: hypothetical protein GY771_00535 [bacterium]|nr:hypothetical protein [bacterium]